MPNSSHAYFDNELHAREIREQGFTVILDFLDKATIAAFRVALAPYLGGHPGRNDFEGFKTERVYTLVARGKVFEDLPEPLPRRLVSVVGDSCDQSQAWRDASGDSR
jgi:hypothetical protein